MNLIDCTVASNLVEGVIALGGGVYNDAGQLTVSNSTFSGNQVFGRNYTSGGGIFNVAYDGASSVALYSSTITGNALNPSPDGSSPNFNANCYGAGVANNQPFSNFTPTLTARNTIIVGNLLVPPFVFPGYAPSMRTSQGRSTRLRFWLTRGPGATTRRLTGL